MPSSSFSSSPSQSPVLACAALLLCIVLAVAVVSAWWLHNYHQTSTLYEPFADHDQVTEESVKRETQRVKNFTALNSQPTPCQPNGKNSDGKPTTASQKCASISNSVQLFAEGSSSYKAVDTCISKYLPIVERQLCDSKHSKKKLDAATKSQSTSKKQQANTKKQEAGIKNQQADIIKVYASK